MGLWKEIVVVAVVIFSGLSGQAQNPQARNSPAVPTVVFSWARWNAHPPQYSIAIASTGTVSYKSTPRSVQHTGAPYTIKFVSAEPFRSRVFRIVQQLNYLDLPSSNRPLSAARQSVKTLSFREGNTHHQIIFRASKNSRVRQLAIMFEDLSRTLELGRRLADLYEHRSPRLASELADLQSLHAEKNAPGIQAVIPTLKDIAGDAGLAPQVRARAAAVVDVFEAKRFAAR